MLIFDAAAAAADAAGRFGTDWLDAHPLRVVEDTAGWVHTRSHCGRQQGTATPVDVALHHAQGVKWCQWCPAGTGTRIEDWVSCTRRAGQLAELLEKKRTCFDALHAALEATELTEAIGAYQVDDPALSRHVRGLTVEARRRLDAATDEDRDSTVRDATKVAQQVCGDGTGHVVVLLECWIPQRALTLTAPWPHTFNADHLVAAVPDVVGHAIVDTTGGWAVDMVGSGVHIEHVQQPATVAQLEAALTLLGDLEVPGDAWAAAVALTS